MIVSHASRNSCNASLAEVVAAIADAQQIPPFQTFFLGQLPDDGKSAKPRYHRQARDKRPEVRARLMFV
jgi:hypothetical protein